MHEPGPGWPSTGEELIELQELLAGEAEAVLAADPWSLSLGGRPLVGGCFVAFARGEAGPGHAGDRAFAAAVAWHPGGPYRRGDQELRGTRRNAPRQAADVVAQSIVDGRVPAAYAPGLLALREGPILAAAVAALDPVPDVVLVDATGTDHPRRAGLALHLGRATGLPTVGVTRSPLVASGPEPPLRRGGLSPVRIEERIVAYWVCTRTAARPVLAHAAWRTSPETAAAAVLLASTEAARTPVPLQEARRAAREARDLSGLG